MSTSSDSRLTRLGTALSLLTTIGVPVGSAAGLVAAFWRSQAGDIEVPRRLLLVSGCLAAALIVTLIWWVVRMWRFSSGRVVVVSATWGKSESQKDVTEFVRKHLADGRLDVLAANSTFDIRSPEEDPAYKHNKNLKVHAKIKGIPNTYFAPEGDHLRLP